MQSVVIYNLAALILITGLSFVPRPGQPTAVVYHPGSDPRSAARTILSINGRLIGPTQPAVGYDSVLIVTLPSWQAIIRSILVHRTVLVDFGAALGCGSAKNRYYRQALKDQR